MNKILVVCALGIIAAFIAVTLFKVPLNSLFFFGAILLCPLMHVFMMSGKHGHKTEDKSNTHH